MRVAGMILVLGGWVERKGEGVFAPEDLKHGEHTHC
jgi:hypothetical protein